MKIDLHVHTSNRSECAKSNENEMVETAIGSGLNGIAITDHHRLVPTERLTSLNRRYAPFHIYCGIEINADQEDWLVLGLQDSTLERKDWNYIELHTFVRSKGGVLVLAHPFRYRAHVGVNLKRYPPDAIELRSNNIRSENVPNIRRLAEELKLPTLTNSDAHHTSALGKYYNPFPSSAIDEGAILTQIRAGTTV